MAAVQAAVAADPSPVENLEGENGIVRSLQFDLAGSEGARAAFAEDMRAYKEASGEFFGNGWIRDEARENWFATTGGFLFLGIYLGVIFLMAAALIIYYKQLSEGYDDRDRFEILQKVGMSEGEVKKTISGQIRAVFFLPLLAAIVHIIVAFLPASKILSVFGVTNIWMLILSLGLTIVVYALVYLFVYRRTARTYFNLVRRRTAA